MSQEKQYFHFTLGPVQGFVAQARRTRDFWAGSFLLSWLSAVAIKAVQAQGGNIIFPIPDKSFLAAVSGDAVETLPEQGGIPNRFMADVSDCNGFDAQVITDAVQQAWQAVCHQVWEHDRAALTQPHKQVVDQAEITRHIWDRQISHFWDMNWVITEGKDPSALDKRKNLRTHIPSVEDGYKCMVMEGYQELSGASGKRSGSKRREFWLNISSYERMGLDLKEDEQLSAIAYVKRRFVHSFHKVKLKIDSVGNSFTIQGWKLSKNVPSVGYMASVPWLKRVLQAQENIHEQLIDFNGHIGSVHDHNPSIGITSERRNHVDGIKKALNCNPSLSLEDISIDGQLYFKSFWENLNNLYPDKRHKYSKIEEAAGNAKRSLLKLYDLMDQRPSPYYAILLMDGDSLGKQMSHEERQPIISHALNKFTKKVSSIVKAHDGFLVYAGGDDVLAILSLDDALPAAVALQQSYKDCFEQASLENGTGVQVHSSLSGAINYCHIGTPLTQVLSDSHDLLDNVAKEGTGRNALAVRIWKPSGLATQWSLPWSKVLDKDAIAKLNQCFQVNIEENTPVISALAEVMAYQKTTDSNISVFSSGFFYKTRELMKRVSSMQQSGMINTEQVVGLLLAEYYQSGQFGKMSHAQREQLTEVFKILIEQSKDFRSEIVDGQAFIDKTSGKNLSGEAGIFLRLLGQKGLGKGDLD
ncbi:type III-B CRISPR-associated protein Cas10/Cmr2 [Psychrobacter lutiphocae]|uniref:type III-B CRISPR-associated protein Cas10/Cmr2 n=1 Tax=Psychrobacter lutiphocae TaxID=540500 RepID=UPI00035CC789|nr:type III-B CRISPR-associated protein Cas10/Cmr2 [Psychrobacter lutiphocae]